MRVNARLDEEAAAQVDHRRGGWIATWAPSMMRRYASLPMDLADATLVLLADHLGHGRILSTDERDFKACRWKQGKPFVNLLAG